MQSGYNIDDLVQEAQSRWLKPAEVLFILQNHKEHQLTHEPPQKPASGSLFLYNKRVLRFFRRDGHSWRRKKDGRTVGEAHERLKVGNAEALNCYYAHGEQNPNFQRRSFWMLDPAYEHIVLVHYRDISEGRQSSRSFSQLSAGSPSAPSQSRSSYTTHYPGSKAVVPQLCEPYHSLSSPGSVEVSSDIVINSNGINDFDKIKGTGATSSSPELEVTQALRRLEEQLSLNDDSLEELVPYYSGNEDSNNSEYFEQNQIYNGSPNMHYDSKNLVLQQDAGENGEHQQSPRHEFAVETKESLSWKDMLEYYESSPDGEPREKHTNTWDRNGMQQTPSRRGPFEHEEDNHWLNNGGSNVTNSSSLSLEEGNSLFPVYSSAIKTHETNPDYYSTYFGQDLVGMPLETDSSLTIAQKQKFTIRHVSPEWGYTSEATKVVIVGSFLSNPYECAWTCMFGDIEVPIEIIQEGVLLCQAPPHLPGKVSLCITSGNRESCSEVREFEYRGKPTGCAHCSSTQAEATKSPDELLLLVRFVQMLLSDTLIQKGDSSVSGVELLRKSKAAEDSWDHVIDAVLVGSWTQSSVTEWVLQELLKDKLQQWFSFRSQDGLELLSCSLSKKEQGIIHMVAALGFEWALSPILNSGISVNFRDINGWTALHWAAHFGREKMVAALIASGASAGAVTDPNSQDPTGKTAAIIAATSGHKGLAGYLSEVALTSHLSSLTLAESELSKDSADVGAEITVNNVSERSVGASEDQLSLKDTLAAVRNVAQAAARIQSAFRAHSFRKRQQKEATDVATSTDEYIILSNDIQGLSAASKLAFRNARDYNSAALSIQKKYRGWKGRKDFLAFRQKVVKIQAHVRGHQVRKNYKVICWAVGIVEKVVIRWRRKGVGLRGFRPELDSTDESEDEDILKIFRKQKVDAAIDDAVSRVLSMVESPEARQQYRRMLEKYRLAKAELEGAESEAASTSHGDISNMDNDDLYQFP